MIQFDVRAADRLWEGRAPADGAPAWYDDVSGLIETATGPAEPHELVDEPVVVEDMHRTTLGRCPRRRRHRRTFGRVVAMKAAAATTTGVLGVAAAAAATTGLVAAVTSVVIPAIEEHVLVTGDTPESGAPGTPSPDATRRSPGSSLDDPGVAVAEAQPASPAPGPAVPGPSAAAAVVPEPAATVTTAAAAPAIVAVTEPAPADAPAAAPTDTRPAKSTPRADERTAPGQDKARPATGGPPGGSGCGRGSCSGGNDHGGRKGDRGDASAEVTERAPRGQARARVH